MINKLRSIVLQNSSYQPESSPTLENGSLKNNLLGFWNDRVKIMSSRLYHMLQYLNKNEQIIVMNSLASTYDKSSPLLKSLLEKNPYRFLKKALRRKRPREQAELPDKYASIDEIVAQYATQGSFSFLLSGPIEGIIPSSLPLIKKPLSPSKVGLGANQKKLCDIITVTDSSDLEPNGTSIEKDNLFSLSEEIPPTLLESTNTLTVECPRCSHSFDVSI